jgi:hypothetical protein
MFLIVDGGTMPIGTTPTTGIDTLCTSRRSVGTQPRSTAATRARSSSRRYDGHMENQSVGVPAVGSSSSNSGEPIYALGAVDQYTRRPGGQEGRLYRVFGDVIGPIVRLVLSLPHTGRYRDRTGNGAWGPNGPTSFLKQAPAGCAPGRTPIRVSHKPPQHAPDS